MRITSPAAATVMVMCELTVPSESNVGVSHYTNAVTRLSWKEKLISAAFRVDSKSRV